MKYILVSGGVVSGIGKGVIGTLHIPCSRLWRLLTESRILVDGFAPEDDRPEGHGDQD